MNTRRIQTGHFHFHSDNLYLDWKVESLPKSSVTNWINPEQVTGEHLRSTLVEVQRKSGTFTSKCFGNYINGVKRCFTSNFNQNIENTLCWNTTGNECLPYYRLLRRVSSGSTHCFRGAGASPTYNSFCRHCFRLKPATRWIHLSSE